jgi:hypothetical protein
MSDVFPYVVPSRDAVAFGGWVTGEDDAALPAELVGWDPQTDVAARQVVTVDLEGFVREAGLPETVRLGLNVSWLSASTGMRGVLASVDLSEQQIIEVLLPGEKLSGNVLLRTTVTLAEDHAGPIGSARSAGSVLAEHLQSVAVEGQSEMFPVSVADLSHSPFGPYASWHLQTSADLEAPFMGAFLLVLNKRDQELTAAVNSTRRNARQDALLEQLEADVATVMVEMAIKLSADLQSDVWPAGTVGHVLHRYLRIAERYKVGRNDSAEDVADFRARIASAVREDGAGRMFS